jgi:hypothetical protein
MGSGMGGTGSCYLVGGGGEKREKAYIMGLSVCCILFCVVYMERPL